MLEINLLPLREARRRADLRQQLMQLVLVLLLTAGAIGLVHSRMQDEVAVATARVQQMDNDIRQFQPQLDQVAKFRKKKAGLEKKLDVIEGLDRARTGPVRVLSELAERTPDRLWLTSLEADGSTLSMKGQSLDNELVAAFLRGLSESPYFQDVDLDGTQLEERGELKLVSFGVRASMVHKPTRKPKDAKAAKDAS
jgi:type IV pilus assembly protein PilN